MLTKIGAFCQTLGIACSYVVSLLSQFSCILPCNSFLSNLCLLLSSNKCSPPPSLPMSSTNRAKILIGAQGNINSQCDFPHFRCTSRLCSCSFKFHGHCYFKILKVQKVEKVQEGALRLLYKDNDRSNEDLLRKASKNSMHMSRLRSLCIEINKTMKKQNPTSMQDIFHFKSVSSPNSSSRTSTTYIT